MQIKGKTVFFSSPPIITGHAGVVGKKEGEGPLRQDFDAIFQDTTMLQQSYELAESAMLHDAIIRALSSAKKSPSQVKFILTGDLLDQCMGSAFALKDLEISSIGMYGACSTMALSLSTGAMLVDAGADCVVAGTSSHFCSSERQFRFPLEYGGQRPPTAQWTVTGAGSAVIESKGNGIKIKAIQIGTITDLGITDANNMGAAMAPVNAILGPYRDKRITLCDMQSTQKLKRGGKIYKGDGSRPSPKIIVFYSSNNVGNAPRIPFRCKRHSPALSKREQPALESVGEFPCHPFPLSAFLLH